jgi:GrpB-like predicted nucleotidyltransferase (UPF0157 family)
LILVGGPEAVERIAIAAYDPAWPERFEQELARILAALGHYVRSIEHIGSTSVPGLAAKPVIDIMIEVDDPNDDSQHREALEATGYRLRVIEADHRMYRTPERDVHLHLWRTGSSHIARHLVFRDHLRASTDARRLYERTKRELADRPWADMNDYADAKSAVIAEIIGAPVSSE